MRFNIFVFALLLSGCYHDDPDYIKFKSVSKDGCECHVTYVEHPNSLSKTVIGGTIK